MNDKLDKVPFLDLAAQHDEIRDELDQAWRLVTASNGFIGGLHVEQFEAEFSAYCGVTHCIGVGNGTDALELIFAGLRLGPGDEVIVPANTFVATVSAIVAVGATPVFVDVDPQTLLVTAAHVEAAITAATAAVAVVHLYGQMPDMDAICRVADRSGVAVIEDAAQAHGAEWSGRRAGSFGRAAAFSFYPGKNLGAFGDGGAIVTSDADLAKRVRSLANHGRSATSHHAHDLAGGNSRLDGLQAAILSVKLRRLDEWNARRRDAAARYRKLLDGVPCQLLVIDARATSVHHLEVVRVSDRGTVTGELDSHGIAWGVHYPIPAHRQPPFAGFHPTPLPVTERAAEQVLSLPMYPTISPDELERVCDALRSATDRKRR
jgi:dTDP-4-amino-4,6-dideoxygalactose transaminase